MPEPVHARLWIEDRLGHLVITLVDDDLPAGAHMISWTVRDADGAIVPSGSYSVIVELDGVRTSEWTFYVQLSEPAMVLEGYQAVTDAYGRYVVPIGLLACGDAFGADPPCVVSDTFGVLGVLDDGGVIRSAQAVATWEPGAEALQVDLTIP